MVAGEQVFTVAPNGMVTAFDIKTGKANWQVSVEEFTDDPLPGIAGGLAVAVVVAFPEMAGTRPHYPASLPASHPASRPLDS